MISFYLMIFIGTVPLCEADEAYTNGHYMSAHALYAEALEENDFPEGPILYNLGNCAFRIGNHSEALLHYRCAQLRMPRNEALRFNQFLAREHLGLAVSSHPSLGEFLAESIESFTASELLSMAGALQLAGLAGWIVFRRKARLCAVFMMLILIAWAASGYVINRHWMAEPAKGIVLHAGTALRQTPHQDLEISFKLRAGEEVFIEEKSDHWIQVRHKKRVGWAEREAIGIIQ